MPIRHTYFDANWNLVADETHAAFRLVVETDENGHVLRRQRETLGARKERVTCSTDPRAGAIMREGDRRRPMSRPRD